MMADSDTDTGLRVDIEPESGTIDEVRLTMLLMAAIERGRKAEQELASAESEKRAIMVALREFSSE